MGGGEAGEEGKRRSRNGIAKERPLRNDSSGGKAQDAQYRHLQGKSGSGSEVQDAQYRYQGRGKGGSGSKVQDAQYRHPHRASACGSEVQDAQYRHQRGAETQGRKGAKTRKRKGGGNPRTQGERRPGDARKTESTRKGQSETRWMKVAEAKPPRKHRRQHEGGSGLTRREYRSRDARGSHKTGLTWIIHAGSPVQKRDPKICRGRGQDKSFDPFQGNPGNP